MTTIQKLIQPQFRRDQINSHQRYNYHNYKSIIEIIIGFIISYTLMRRYCDHFCSLKSQRISNFIKKTEVRCAFKNHISPQYNLCLNCGETRCAKDNEGDQKNSCSFQHWNAHKHPIVLQIISMQIYCYTCDLLVLDFEADTSSKGDKKKIEKIVELHEKIISLTNKFLSNKTQKRIKENMKKIESSPGKQIVLRKKQTKKQQKKNGLRVFGLSNIGNTCYFNSVLQCLYATVQLHDIYQRIEYKDDFNLVFRKFLKNNEKVFCPKGIFSMICKQHKNFKSMEQQDAFQLFVFLINSLIQSTTKSKSKEVKQNIGSIFGFILVSRLECMNCLDIKWIKDFSLGISIPLCKKVHKKVQKIQEQQSIQQIPKQQIGEQGLVNPFYKPSNTFLDWFFGPEVFNKSNSYTCEKCNQSNAIHRFYIKDPPPVLVINFKRFHNNGSKNDSSVHIPPQISIKSYCLNSFQTIDYEIYGAVIHSGSSKAGHYVSYTKRNNQWFYFSDQHFKSANFTTLKNNNPYVIFYRRIIPQNQQIQIKFEMQDRKKSE